MHAASCPVHQPGLCIANANRKPAPKSELRACFSSGVTGRRGSRNSLCVLLKIHYVV